MHVNPGNPSTKANPFLRLTEDKPAPARDKAAQSSAPAQGQKRTLGERPGAKPKPAELASFMPEEKQALRKILDTPLPPESQVLGRSASEHSEIRTFGREAGVLRVDTERKGQRDEVVTRFFGAPDSQLGLTAPRGTLRSVETRKQGQPGPDGHAPAVHTLEYTNGLSQTIAESQRGELFWLGLAEKPAK